MLNKKGFSLVEVLICFTFITTLLLTIYTQTLKYRVKVRDDYMELVITRHYFNIWEIFESDYEGFEDCIKLYYIIENSPQRIIIPIDGFSKNRVFVEYQYQKNVLLDKTMYELKLTVSGDTPVVDLINMSSGMNYRKVVVYHE